MNALKIITLTFFKVAIATNANAENISWTDWKIAQTGSPGFANGEISLLNKTIAINYSGEIFFAQTSGGINYWIPATPYVNSFINNPPPNADIIALIGGNAISNTITFSEPVNNPVLAIVSLGKENSEARYEFNTPFTILSSDIGFFGGSDTALSKSLAGNVLKGKQGHGSIQFSDLISSISWTVPMHNEWHGFTVGIAANTPDCGEVNTGTVATNLDLFLPSLSYEAPSGSVNLWGDLEFIGTDSSGRLLWRLRNYGENPPGACTPPINP